MDFFGNILIGMVEFDKPGWFEKEEIEIVPVLRNCLSDLEEELDVMTEAVFASMVGWNFD